MANQNSTTSEDEDVNMPVLGQESSGPPDLLLDALIQFNKAGQRLAELWELDNDYGRHPIDTCKAYPFTQSFDEIMTNVEQWTEAALNKKREDKLRRVQGKHSSHWRLGEHPCSACRNCGALMRPSGPYFELVIVKWGGKKEVTLAQHTLLEGGPSQS